MTDHCVVYYIVMATASLPDLVIDSDNAWNRNESRSYLQYVTLFGLVYHTHRLTLFVSCVAVCVCVCVCLCLCVDRKEFKSRIR